MATMNYSKMTDEELISYLLVYSSNPAGHSEEIAAIRQELNDRHNGVTPEPKSLKRKKGMYSYNSQVSYATGAEASIAEERDIAIAEILMLCDYVDGDVCYTPGWSADNAAWVSVCITDMNITHPYRFASNISCLKAIATLGKRKLDLIFNFQVSPKCPCPPCPPYPPPCPPCPPYPPPPCPPCEEISVWLELLPVEGFYEIGEAVPMPIKMVAHVHGKPKRPALIQFSRDDSVLYTVPYISGCDDRYVYVYNDTSNPVMTTTKFEVSVIVGNVVVQDKKWYTFGFWSYYGYSDDGTLPETLDSFTRDKIEPGDISHKFTCYNKHPLVAYPASWGKLCKIYDENKFVITQTFTCVQKLFRMKDDSLVSYYVYMLDHPVMISDYKMEFLFEEK